MAATATIYVERKSERDIKFRDLYIVVDDQPEKTLLFGQSVEIPVTPGEHEIKATTRLFTVREKFQVREGETIRFEGINVVKPGVLNVMAFISGSVAYKPILNRL